MTTLTRRYRFSASHRLYAPSLSEETNQEVFGKCANPYGHGHNYVLEVSVAGDPDPTTGLTLPRREFDSWVRSTAVERLDHAHLNAEVDAFQALVPTAENILAVVAGWLRDGWTEHFPGRALGLAGLRLEETPRNSCRLPPESFKDRP